MHPIKTPKIRAQIHGIPDLKTNSLRDHLIGNPHFDPRGFTSFLKPVKTQPFPKPDSFGGFDKCEGKIYPNYLPRMAAHLKTGTSNGATHIECTSDFPPGKMPHCPNWKIESGLRPKGPAEDFFRFSEMK